MALARVSVLDRSYEFANGTTVGFVRRHFGLTPHQGNLYCKTTSAFVPEDGFVAAGHEYMFRGDIGAIPIVSDAAALQRSLRTLAAMYVLAWLTYFFLPLWTSTPALFFFLNILATMLIDWSMRPTPALAAPWLAAAAALAAHAVLAHWACIAAAHALTATALAVATVLRLSPAGALALFVGAAAIGAPPLLDGCVLRHPFN